MHGKHRMCGLRRLLFLEASVNTHQYLAKTIKVIIEKLVVIMYDMFSGTDSIDDARPEMFARKQII